jgi:hypothetical protein
MKFPHVVFKCLPSLILMTSALSLQAKAPVCTPTDLVRDGNTLTAVLINPTHDVVGNVNATGCDIGVYYGPGVKGKVLLAKITGANYYGVVNNGAKVEIGFSAISNIGPNAVLGVYDSGYAVYFVEGSNAQGSVHDNLIWDYGWGGIIINGPLAANASVVNNVVTGQGPSTTIAQVGIQLGFGATGNVQGNFVTANSYSGSAGFANGIYVFGGPCYATLSPFVSKATIQGNTLIGNDAGIEVDNDDSSCNTSTTPTYNVISNNIVQNKSVTNTDGNLSPAGAYQAGIENSGTGDIITGNNVCGAGYTPVATPPPFLFYIDLAQAFGTTVTGNTTSATCGCQGSLFNWSGNNSGWSDDKKCHRPGH